MLRPLIKTLTLCTTLTLPVAAMAEESTPLSDGLMALWEAWAQAAELTKEELDAVIANEPHNVLVQTSIYLTSNLKSSTRNNLQEAWRGEHINQLEALQLCLAAHHFVQNNESEITALWHFIQEQELLEENDALQFVAGRMVSFASAPYTIRRYDVTYDNPTLLGNYLTADKLPPCGTFFAEGSGLVRDLFSDTGRAALTQSGFTLMLALAKERQNNNQSAETLWKWLAKMNLKH